MPSWGIHLKIARKLNEILKLDNDLFTFGNLIPDVDSDSIYTRRKAHYCTGITFEKCPAELEIDLKSFQYDYKENYTNPLIIGYLCHLLTDNFYNEYIYLNKWVQNEDKQVIGIFDKNKNIIDVTDDFHKTLEYKHKDLELYAKYIYNYEPLFIPNNVNLILNNIQLLKDKFYSDQNVIKRLKYLNDGEFKKFNKLSDEEIKNNDNYVLFTKNELDKLFNDCYYYIIKYLKNIGIINNEK